jgi:predicted DNA-binding protein YlxM (UPF0122 family)
LQLTNERKNRIIDLYFNQHKTYAEIAEIERISPRDIHAVIKEEEARRQKYQHEQQEQELSSKAYKLFSKGKRPVQVAITLNLREPEITKLYGEYLKLNRFHKLYSAYKELGDEGIGDFLKLYKLSKKEGVSRQQVVKLLQLVDEDNAGGLAQIARCHKWRIEEIHDMDIQIERSRNYLYRLNNEIARSRNYWNS